MNRNRKKKRKVYESCVYKLNDYAWEASLSSFCYASAEASSWRTDNRKKESAYTMHAKTRVCLFFLSSSLALKSWHQRRRLKKERDISCLGNQWLKRPSVPDARSLIKSEWPFPQVLFLSVKIGPAGPLTSWQERDLRSLIPSVLMVGQRAEVVFERKKVDRPQEKRRNGRSFPSFF